MAHLLVVDDSAFDLTFTGKLLERNAEWTVAFAHNGMQAIEHMKSHLPDLVLTDLQMPEITAPKLPICTPWQLVEQLDFEKEVTGMYMSGHPLDNFKFELKYYNITSLTDFNEIKNAIGSFINQSHFKYLKS